MGLFVRTKTGHVWGRRPMRMDEAERVACSRSAPPRHFTPVAGRLGGSAIHHFTCTPGQRLEGSRPYPQSLEAWYGGWEKISCKILSKGRMSNEWYRNWFLNYKCLIGQCCMMCIQRCDASDRSVVVKRQMVVHDDFLRVGR